METGIPDEGRAVTALIVEDEMPIRYFMEMVLKRHVRRVLSASTGTEGVDLFYQHASGIDLLITDISLPGIRGTEVAARAREVRPDLPVLFASGSFGMEPIAIDEYVPGATFLAKPFTMEQLIEAVD